jgi:putative ABC transport system permease protein
MELLHVFRNLFMLIVVTIGVMSVANTMMKSVNERVREIGTLRSLGFLRRDLTLLFACEGGFLSLLACGVGLGLTFLIGTAISLSGIKFRAGVLSVPIQLAVAPAPGAWIISGAVLSLLATGTAWFCARRASRMVIADALRHV